MRGEGGGMEERDERRGMREEGRGMRGEGWEERDGRRGMRGEG